MNRKKHHNPYLIKALLKQGMEDNPGTRFTWQGKKIYYDYESWNVLTKENVIRSFSSLDGALDLLFG